MVSGAILFLRGFPGQGVCAICGWIWDIGDQMYSRRVHHQGISGRRDFLPERSDSGMSIWSTNISQLRVDN